jgi:hypothetical protein
MDMEREIIKSREIFLEISHVMRRGIPYQFINNKLNSETLIERNFGVWTLIWEFIVYSTDFDSRV